MKKLFAVALAFVLSMSLMLTTICAAGLVSVNANSQPKAGEIFNVSVSLNQNPGIAYIQCKVTLPTKL